MRNNEFEPDEANNSSLYIQYKLRNISSKFNLNKKKSELHSTSLPNYTSTQSNKTNNSIKTSKTNNTYNTSNEKEFSTLNVNQLNTEELQNQIDLIKKYNESKLKEINNVCQEINSRDEKINQLSQSICNSLKSVDTVQEEIDENNFKNKQSKEISELKIEINNLKRKHNKRVLDKQKESDQGLKKLLEHRRDEYNVTINKLGEEAETNIYNLQDQIYKIKKELDTFDDTNICNNKDSEKENVIYLF